MLSLCIKQLYIVEFQKMIEAGRRKFAKIWSGRVHQLYQELEMADGILYESMPSEVRQFVQEANQSTEVVLNILLKVQTSG